MQNSKKDMIKNMGVLGVMVAGAVLLAPAHALTLSGVADVNITSDTSASAKNMAMAEARRQIIKDTVSQYANPEQFAAAMADAKDSDLMNLIASSGIDGEQVSATTYSAKITMTLDKVATKKWLDEKNVQNWLPDNEGSDKFSATVFLSDKILDWAEINRIARNENVNLDVKNMSGNQINIQLPSGVRSQFTIAAREAGWKYTDVDGVLKLWK